MSSPCWNGQRTRKTGQEVTQTHVPRAREGGRGAWLPADLQHPFPCPPAHSAPWGRLALWLLSGQRRIGRESEAGGNWAEMFPRLPHWETAGWQRLLPLPGPCAPQSSPRNRPTGFGALPHGPVLGMAHQPWVLSHLLLAPLRPTYMLERSPKLPCIPTGGACQTPTDGHAGVSPELGALKPGQEWERPEEEEGRGDSARSPRHIWWLCSGVQLPRKPSRWAVQPTPQEALLQLQDRDLVWSPGVITPAAALQGQEVGCLALHVPGVGRAKGLPLPGSHAEGINAPPNTDSRLFSLSQAAALMAFGAHRGLASSQPVPAGKEMQGKGRARVSASRDPSEPWLHQPWQMAGDKSLNPMSPTSVPC